MFENNEFILQQPTATNDRICSSHPVCSTDQYESTIGTIDTQRVCTDHTICEVTGEQPLIKQQRMVKQLCTLQILYVKLCLGLC